MKKFIFAVASLGVLPAAFADEPKSVLAPTPAPVAAAPVEVKSNCVNGRCYVVRQPRFERNVSVVTTCDSCGVKETARTVTRIRRRR